MSRSFAGIVAGMIAGAAGATALNAVTFGGTPTATLGLLLR